MCKRKYTPWLISLVIALALGEGVLRLQQKLGPRVDLETYDIMGYRPHSIFQHNHAPGKQTLQYQSDKGITFYTAVFDEQGIIRQDRLLPNDNNPQTTRVLFMGDSFMQGYDDANTIPHIIKEELARRQPPLVINSFNAGCSTYSPVIHVALGRYLIPQIKPQAVVVDIDETDFFDDERAYRDLVKRDAQGQIVAVDNHMATNAYFQLMKRVTSEPLYLMRFAHLAYYFIGPGIPSRAREPTIQPPFGRFDFSRMELEKLKANYGPELKDFKSHIVELLQLIKGTQEHPLKALLCYHPHLRHLEPRKRYSNFMQEILSQAAQEVGVPFYNVTPYLQTLSQGHPEKFYFEPDIHLNYEGQRLYANGIAAKLAEILEAK